MRLGVEYPDEYFIQSWSDDGTILAKREDIAADWDVRISTKDETAEKSYRETKARGNEKADPTVVHTWVLE